MTKIDHAPVLVTQGVGTSKPGIGSKIGNALLSVCRAAMAVCATICLGILKAIAASVLLAVGFVAGFVASVIVETIIEQRWVLLIGLSLMVLLWIWMQNDPHRPRTRPYHADPTPDRIMR
jgi:hypothetical protein